MEAEKWGFIDPYTRAHVEELEAALERVKAWPVFKAQAPDELWTAVADALAGRKDE